MSQERRKHTCHAGEAGISSRNHYDDEATVLSGCQRCVRECQIENFHTRQPVDSAKEQKACAASVYPQPTLKTE